MSRPLASGSAASLCSLPFLILLSAVCAFPLRVPAATATPAILAAVADDPAVVGRWDSLIQAELVPIHVILLPNGKLLYIDRHDQGTHDMIPRVWDPATNVTIKTPSPGYDLFCSGHSILRNGDVFFSGGHIVDGEGEDQVRIYNWRSNTWDAGIGHMPAGRWYPTNTTLPNGDVLILSGSIYADIPNEIPEIYDSRAHALRELDDAKLGVGLYPFVFLAGRNKVFLGGPDSLTRFLDLTGKGGFTEVGMTRIGKLRGYGTSVMYAPGKVMMCGGGKEPPTASTEIIDLYAAHPAWAYSDSMHYARRQATGVLLPDGKVLVTGGTSGWGFNNADGAVYNAEMWDPQTGKWSVLAPASTQRLYHSFSLLLPDGRVLTGGGGHPGDEADILSEHPDFEIYEPPYLFKGTRPVIDAVPDTLYYGKPFTLSTRNAGSFRVSLLRTAAVTHAFDQNANFNGLTVTRASATALTVGPPADSVISPPGPHLLFLLDSAGIPSKGKIVWLASSPGNASLAPVFGAADWRLIQVGNRLRVEGMDRSEGAQCILMNTQGKRMAVLEPMAAGEFRLPAGHRGIYAAVVRQGNRKHTGTIFIP